MRRLEASSTRIADQAPEARSLDSEEGLPLQQDPTGFEDPVQKHAHHHNAQGQQGGALL